MLLSVIRILLKGFMFLLYCLLCPFFKLPSLKKKQQCSLIINPILLQSATEIARKIRKREISCEEVIIAYIERCKEVNPLINAIVQDRFEMAIQEARKIDDFLKVTTMDEATITNEKPLLGLPITVKESIAVQGMSHTVGMKDTPSKAMHDADVVAKIRKAGGIVLLVSNTPELCLWWETFNKVTGTTKNPYDTRRTAGGSSGGEGALLGAGASLLSLGSDVAGSVRIPAMFCGVFGHKPTPNWISIEGHKPSATDENWPNYFAIGSMVRYATDLPLLLTVMSQSNDARISFNKIVDLKKIKFFYMDNSGSNITNCIHSDIKNAIYKLIRHLEVTHKVEVHKGYLESMKMFFEISVIILFNSKGVYSMYNRLDDPKKSKSVFTEFLKYIFFMSSHSYPAICYGIANCLVRKLPRSWYNELIEKRAQIKKQLEELLGDNGVLIFPSFHTSAFYPNEILYNVNNVTYMIVFNMLGLPVTQCPLGFDKNQLPIGVQIVANPGCDHLTIAVAQEIERIFGGWRQPAENKEPICKPIERNC